jgi:hypothetical protein
MILRVAPTLLQLAKAFKLGGVVARLLYARIDAPRFASIYSAKGRWSLLDDLTSVPQASLPTAARQTRVKAVGKTAVLANDEKPSYRSAHKMMDLADIEQVICRAAIDLGIAFDGELFRRQVVP